MAKQATKKVKKKPVVDVAKDPAQLAWEVYKKAMDAQRAPVTHRIANQFITIKSKALCDAFLVYLRKGYLPGPAAELCNIARSTAFKWRLEDPDFAKGWEEAMEEANDFFEQDLQRRAQDGVDRPVYQQGACVGYTREYSDSLAIMMLKGRRSHYKERPPEDAKDATPVQPSIVIHGGAEDVQVTVKKKEKDK